MRQPGVSPIFEQEEAGRCEGRAQEPCLTCKWKGSPQKWGHVVLSSTTLLFLVTSKMNLCALDMKIDIETGVPGRVVGSGVGEKFTGALFEGLWDQKDPLYILPLWDQRRDCLAWSSLGKSY